MVIGMAKKRLAKPRLPICYCKVCGKTYTHFTDSCTDCWSLHQMEAIKILDFSIGGEIKWNG